MHYELLTKDIKIGPRTEKFEDNNYTIFWEGLIFIKGLTPGEESLQRFVEELKKKPLPTAVECLSGVFACIIHDKKEDSYFSFLDNSGLFNLFYSSNYISTSFIRLVELSHLKKNDIKPASYSDLVAATSFMRWETYFDSVKKMRYDEIIVDDGSNIKIVKKELRDIFTIKKSGKTIIEEYGKIADSFKKIKGRISFDLTGGLDTRMNCSAFKYHDLEFETAISGMPGNWDCEYSKLVAEALGTEHYVHYHSVRANHLEKELEECFKYFEPLLDTLIFHRYLQFQKEKLSRNCILTVTGHAGELYKAEFIWNLDNGNPKKAIDQMLDWGANIRYGTALRQIPHDIYSEPYRKYSMDYGNRVRKFLIENFGSDKSGKVGPKMYTYFHEASRSTNFGAVINRFSPLLDRDLIPCGTSLKTTTRTFKGGIKRLLFQPWDDRDSFESRIITFLNKNAAKVKITNSLGINASTKRVDRLRKLYKYTKAKIKKPKVDFVSPLHPEFYPIVRSLNKTEEMFEILKNEGILDKKVKVEEIQNDHIGSLFTIGRFIEFCDNLN